MENKNCWSILGYGFLFAVPFIAMIAGKIAHYWNTNEGVVDLGFILILITLCNGMTYVRCVLLENKITKLENKLNSNKNKD